MKCQVCGAKISNKETTCPACGESVLKIDCTKSVKIVNIASYVLFFVAVLLTVIRFMLGPGSGLGESTIWLVIGIFVLMNLIFTFAVKGVNKISKILMIIALLIVLRSVVGGF